MKFVLFWACLALYIMAHSEAQICNGFVRPERISCERGRDEGSGGLFCSFNANNRMWYYSQRTLSCQNLAYRGCGGNNNRYCTLESCRRKCVRS